MVWMKTYFDEIRNYIFCTIINSSYLSLNIIEETSRIFSLSIILKLRSRQESSFVLTRFLKMLRSLPVILVLDFL